MIDNFKHIIWDWNGTLFNDVELSVNIINNILKDMKLKELSIIDYKNIFTFPIRDYYKKAGINFENYSFEETGALWISEYEKRKLEGFLYEGTSETLQFISDKGMEQSILSAYSQITLVDIVRHFNLEHFFSYLTGLNNIYADSKIELGKKFIKNIVHSNEEVLLIGDTVHDYEVAKEIGVVCLLIADGHQSKEKLSVCGVPVLDNIKEICNY
ncbi:MAG: HAD hydrolase-like protein [Ignavibacteriaceae bacterium]